jgi:hypothetical protein
LFHLYWFFVQIFQEINILHNNNVPVAEMSSQLSPWAAALFQFLPPFIRRELLLHQESDNSAQLSQIDTEQLLAHLVETEMIKRTKEGRYKGRKFSSVCHFFGYQARGSIPSNFDCDYAYVSTVPLYFRKLMNVLILMAILITLNNLGSWTYLPAYDCSWIDGVHGNCG